SSALLPEGFDELPPELITLADRFIDSLTKPIHPAPLTVQQLSDMFQQFYSTAQQAIGKHVSQSYLSLSSQKPRSRTPTTQMLSKAEMAQKKRDRKLLEVKRIALEEAIEKRVTEGVYDKIWRHKSTDDEARDDSLHSKIAALKVVGVNLGHLGVELDSEAKAKLVDRELQESTKALAAMNEKKYPLGKLTLLKQAHKAIVDCLTKHITTTSADSLLPTLIYTLIVSPPELQLNAVSNLYFTQRFRACNFIDGEAAYCLTNFEAAISFLETVDLATLNIDNVDGPSHSPASSLHSLRDTLKPSTPHPTTTTTATHITALHPTHASVQATQAAQKARGLSFTTPIDLATTAVSTADQGIRGIGVALENSYKFLFAHTRGDIAPKTLEDARKLVDTPSNPAISALQRTDSDTGSSNDDKPTGSKPASLREPSPARGGPASSPSPSPARAAAAAAAGLEPLKHIGNIGTSIGRFASVGMRGLARVAPTTSAPAPPTTQQLQGKELLEALPELAKDLVPTTTPLERLEFKPNRRFVECEDVRELKIGEVEGLLKEYRALVGELRRRGLIE
ncbi:hypothetical protein FN846DRAFT_779322, partial [Sphaerosporella brunnea]